MANEQVIQKKVEEFVQSQESFTSVDIANAVKKEGNWIRNKEVAKWLRENMNAYRSYQKTQIDLDNGKHANLYHPSFADADNYDKRDQAGISIDEFNRSYLKPAVSNRVSMIASNSSSVPVQSNTASPATSGGPTVVQNPSNGDGLRLSISHKRIRIPASLVKQLNWPVGSSVDLSKFSFTNPVTAKLRVQKDGRISLPSRCVNSQVYAKVNLENNNIVKVEDA